MKKASLYPLTFLPIYQSYIWGGQRIAELYRRLNPPPVCAESWELSDRPEGLSRIANGPWQGRTFHDLIQTYPREILGADTPPRRFPLLVKLIDAAQRLSLQVHPDDASAAGIGGEPKSEIWIILAATPTAYVYSGFKEPVTPDTFRAALSARKLPDLLHRIAVQPGDALFIPGGRVHAIGEGCLLYEIQQNSNTTFRVHDWDRVGPDGRPRALHLDQALKVIRWNDTASGLIRNPSAGSSESRLIFDCPLFRVDQFGVREDFDLAPHPDGFQILFVETGALVFEDANGDTTPAARGSSWLIPARLERLRLRARSADEPVRLLRVTVPRGS